MDTQKKANLANRYFFTNVQPVEDYDEYWIRYKPQRVGRMRWARITIPQKIVYAAVLLAIFLFFAHLGSSGLMYLLVILASVFVVVQLLNMTYPTHVFFDAEGLQLRWLRSWCNISSGLIRWDRLTHVNVRKERRFNATESILEFNLISAQMPWKDRVLYQLIAPDLASGWFGAGRSKLMLRLDGIASSDDRKRLQLGLKRFLPVFRIDASVSDELSMGLRVESYTDLWMDALHSGVRRIREEPLEAGAHVLDNAYEIVGQVGAGGQALVYEALSRAEPDKKVILKEFVLPAHAGAAVRRRVLENIEQEAQLLKRLKHPNVVKLLDFFVEDQRAYLVLERLNGTTLKQIVEQKGTLSEQECILFGLQMCEILGYLHAQKVVHRDFTPDNLILAHGDILKLIDFNVAMQLESDNFKTVAGKHAYIPPEQFRGKATSQSDIYAAGGTLYFMATGRDPEPISCSHPRSERGELSALFDDIVARATTIDLKDRYPDCIPLRTDLQHLKHLYGC